MSKPNPNRFTLVTSSIKLKSNNKLLQKSLELDIHRNNPKEGQFGLDGQDPDKKGAKKILESIDVANRLTIDEAKETKRKAQLILVFLLTEGANTIKSNELINTLEILHTREVVLEKQKKFIEYLTRSSENKSPIAPIVLGYAY
ncbi:9947_t:CDS:2 [Scutellospora calospora]|uniref:9947_t:CDS:1 n=1 Tax=Scutellospora calospora TaxID=85575 RepID=A0ACA9KB40_9GLOM|nr:9947_t:CDS:2 [Scutellospora calospora]